eukprot:CAMPEP_0119565016 /NCGR_PEP_ID=MMETSP1352-20130426/28726_1 /TAXON_ID=265584 /ORGANISM="Stauroneis constricta, Strain CCMP1120" /LENGTH=117 /DNA_ID=CAMNT_0007613853 /DNA_START=6 /DNA_END=359 /DNA_ORIENTATION=+
MTGVVSRDECLHLNDILGVKTLAGCHNLKHELPNRDDRFTNSASQPFSEDETKHRSSWLMPRMARRMTRTSKHHVSQWRTEVNVNAGECDKLRKLLSERMGSVADGEEHLPAACKKL